MRELLNGPRSICVFNVSVSLVVTHFTYAVPASKADREPNPNMPVFDLLGAADDRGLVIVNEVNESDRFLAMSVFVFF